MKTQKTLSVKITWKSNGTNHIYTVTEFDKTATFEQVEKDVKGISKDYIKNLFTNPLDAIAQNIHTFEPSQKTIEVNGVTHDLPKGKINLCGMDYLNTEDKKSAQNILMWLQADISGLANCPKKAGVFKNSIRKKIGQYAKILLTKDDSPLYPNDDDVHVLLHACATRKGNELNTLGERKTAMLVEYVLNRKMHQKAVEVAVKSKEKALNGVSVTADLSVTDAKKAVSNAEKARQAEKAQKQAERKAEKAKAKAEKTKAE